MANTPRKNWTRDELIIAMNLYTQLSFGQFSSTNKFIKLVAEKMERSPASLSMKLCNLASFDRVHQQRGVSGLKGASRQDAAIWAEFESNWDVLALLSQERFDELVEGEQLPYSVIEDFNKPDFETDRVASAKQRRGHSFFSRAVKVSYHYTCCMTGNPISILLTASHIVPWKDSKKNRLNPSNGLCLAKTQDTAFDRGLITLDEKLRVVLSKRIREYVTLETIRDNFQRYEGKPITLPHRFQPDQQFLAYHREKIFVA
ncbi:HNH endonuclease [Pelagicoccus sp. SDUM812002]|uniref:HNH endonuclease n=1 Tax=Pelagicoccus sp. SDUM812002 TaxID=3041266 RepID=UPI00281046FB|nr:HNH endonuclease [Pelagicoccus sp. SDUM812002]MDQ8187091.1 HNH endonuclease [Pelagicoccus sp. SDUM812002]